jgi:predicted RNA-binding protein
MRGTITKRLRRQAHEETKGTYAKNRIEYYTQKGEKFIVVDCFRGRYQALKQLYKIAKHIYPSKKMPKLRIMPVPKQNRGSQGVGLSDMREFLDILQ